MWLIFVFLSQAFALWPFTHKPESSVPINTQMKNITSNMPNVTQQFSTWKVSVGVQTLFQIRKQIDPLPKLLDTLWSSVQSCKIDDIDIEQFAKFESDLASLYKTLDKGYKGYDDVGMATSIGNIIDKSRQPLGQIVGKVAKLVVRKDCKRAKEWSRPTADLSSALASASKKYELKQTSNTIPQISPCTSEEQFMYYLGGNNVSFLSAKAQLNTTQLNTTQLNTTDLNSTDLNSDVGFSVGGLSPTDFNISDFNVTKFNELVFNEVELGSNGNAE